MSSRNPVVVRGGERGMMLVEILIVIAIMALIAGGIGIAVFKSYVGARVHAAETSARSLRHLVGVFWATHDDSICPTADQLFEAGIVDEASSRKDPWGHAWKIECNGARVTVSSDGPDRQSGTADDIRVPPRTS